MSTYPHQPVDATGIQRQLGSMSLNQAYSSPRKDYRGGAEIIDFGPRSTSKNLKMMKSPSSSSSSVFEKFTIRRAIVEKGKRRTWADTTTVLIPISQEELEKEVADQTRKSVSFSKRLDKLANKSRFQHTAVLKVIDDVNRQDPDPFAKWVLVMIKSDQTSMGFGQPTVTTAIHLILKRTIDDIDDARGGSSSLPFQASHGSSKPSGPVGGHGPPNGQGSLGGSQRMPPSGPGISMYGQLGSGGIHPREGLHPSHERGMNQPPPHHPGPSNPAQASYPPRDPPGGLRAYPNGDSWAKPPYPIGQHQHPPPPSPGRPSHPASSAQAYLARGAAGGFGGPTGNPQDPRGAAGGFGGGAMGGPQDPRLYPAGAGDDPLQPVRGGTVGGGSGVGMRADVRPPHSTGQQPPPPPPLPGTFGQPPPPAPMYSNRDPVGVSMGSTGGLQGARGYPGGGDPSAPTRVDTVSGGGRGNPTSTASPSAFDGRSRQPLPPPLSTFPASGPRQSDRPAHDHGQVPRRRPSTSSSNARHGTRAMPEFVDESDDDDSHRDTDEDSQLTNPTIYSGGTSPRSPLFPKTFAKGSVKGNKPGHARRPGEQSSRHAFDRRPSTSSSHRPRRPSFNREVQEVVEALLMGDRPRQGSVHRDRPSLARQPSRAGERRSTARRPPSDRLDTTPPPSRHRRGGRSERASRDTLAQIISDHVRSQTRLDAEVEDDDDDSEDDEDDEYSYDDESEAIRYQAKSRRHDRPKEPRRREEYSTLRNDRPRTRSRRASTEQYHGFAPSSSGRRR